MPPKKSKSKGLVKRHHGFSAVLFVLGTLFPPLAVAARFGIGSDFWLNLLLTICGYFPGHIHNFYIQNIRNNKNNRRTPKWSQRYGLVNTTKIKQREARSQWATRYNEQLPNSTLENQEYEEGQNDAPSISSNQTPDAQANGHEFWGREDEAFYGRNGRPESASMRSEESGGRWHYPANFDDVSVVDTNHSVKKKKSDRWARTEDAYNMPDDGSLKKKKKKKSKKTRSTENDTIYNRPMDDDYEGGPEGANGNGNGNGSASRDDDLNHEF
ncbi:hypothetical protein SISSUDRAFT_522207 [Sistotremastrum suecicum HHB10207 ss-3]|uniref:Uncharacterized protein n=1 Tax=Sistotremastrum suecicum HHB10207 ss-3 TaxID=1314776 RepID=A0A165XXG2_9AGAM|nr:hypothetical protein SISSUDRAFT_522207 [Sistotremastrum suecicum HHB10207 ss-3]